MPIMEDTAASINETTKKVTMTVSDTYFERLFRLFFWEFLFFPLGCATSIRSTKINIVLRYIMHLIR